VANPNLMKLIKLHNPNGTAAVNEFKESFPNERLDLSGETLHELNFDKADLSGANCKNTRFDKVSLKDANCTYCDFRFSVLAKCNIEGCDFEGSDFRGFENYITKFSQDQQEGTLNIQSVQRLLSPPNWMNDADKLPTFEDRNPHLQVPLPPRDFDKRLTGVSGEYAPVAQRRPRRRRFGDDPDEQLEVSL